MGNARIRKQNNYLDIALRAMKSARTLDADHCLEDLMCAWECIGKARAILGDTPNVLAHVDMCLALKQSIKNRLYALDALERTPGAPGRPPARQDA